MSGVHTGLIHGTAGSHYRRQAHDPPPNTALASALGPPWEGLGLPLSTPRRRRNEGPLLKLKTGLVMVPWGKLPGWGLSPDAPLQLPEVCHSCPGDPPKPKGASQLTADDRVSDSGGGKRGKECVRAAPHPHFTPAILRSRCGRAGSLRTARSRPPSTTQPWKAPRTSCLPHPRGVETATQTGSPQGLRPQGEWGGDVLPSDTRLLSELLPVWAVGNRPGVGLRGWGSGTLPRNVTQGRSLLRAAASLPDKRECAH